MDVRLFLAAVAVSLNWRMPVNAALTRVALDQAESLVASRMGVDRADRLWAWNAIEGSVTLVTPAGNRRTVEIDDDIRALDVDADRGIAILGNDGVSVRTVSLDGKMISQFKLGATATNILWLERNQVAVTPERTTALVEVWNTATKVRVRTLGVVPEIKVPDRGAVLNRATLIRFDGARRELAVLDAFYGGLTVFDANGRAVRSAQVTHPRLDANIAWLKGVDQNAKANGQISTPTFYNYPRISMSSDGAVWLGEESATAQSITLVRVLPSGKVERKSLLVPECTSVRYEVWQDRLVFFREPKSPRKQCTTTKEISR